MYNYIKFTQNSPIVLFYKVLSRSNKTFYSDLTLLCKVYNTTMVYCVLSWYIYYN